MAMVEKALTGRISSAGLTGMMNARTGLSGALNLGGSYAKDYDILINKPKINGVELISDISFEELGDHALTDNEILAILKRAGF